MFRRLRVLAAFFMVPLVLFSNPQQASAAVVPGPWKGFAETIPLPVVGDLYGGNGECKFNARHAGTQIDIGTGGWCIGLADVTPGSTQPMEAGSSIGIQFSGQQGAGLSCSSATYSAVLGDHDRNGTIRVAGSIPAGAASLPPVLSETSQCDITQVCVYVGNGTQDGCFDFLLPYPEDVAAEGTCVHGFPGEVKYEWKNRGVNQYNTSGVDWGLEISIAITTSGPSTATWYALQHTNGTGTTNQNARDITLNAKWDLLTETRLPYMGNVNVPPEMPARDSLPWGFEIFAVPDPGNWNLTGPTVGHYGKTKASEIPDEAVDYWGGITQPEHCRWWIGKQLADIPDTEIDDPFFDLNGLGPTVQPEEPAPVIDPPPAVEPPDGFNWLAAIWAMLQSIFNILGGLASAIVNGIVGALESMFDRLFVPDADFMESKFTGLEDDWEDTAPAKYLDAGTGFTAGSVSGCGGLPLNVTLPGDVQIDEHVGAACSGAMASAAGIVRTVLSAVIVITGGMACIRALGSGLGWNPNVGSRETGA